MSSHHYGYNDLNQRTEALLDDSSKWVYSYDAMGQVTDGAKRWTDQQPVPGARFGYAYDGIGNRTSATRNGRQAVYEADLANQYIGRQVPGFIDVFGTAAADAEGDPSQRVRRERNFRGNQRRRRVRLQLASPLTRSPGRGKTSPPASRTPRFAAPS